jgi:hypothetical protein
MVVCEHTNGLDKETVHGPKNFFSETVPDTFAITPPGADRCRPWPRTIKSSPSISEDTTGAINPKGSNRMQ